VPVTVMGTRVKQAHNNVNFQRR